MVYAALAIAFYLGGLICSWGMLRHDWEDAFDVWDVILWPYFFIVDLFYD